MHDGESYHPCCDNANDGNDAGAETRGNIVSSDVGHFCAAETTRACPNGDGDCEAGDTCDVAADRRTAIWVCR